MTAMAIDHAPPADSEPDELRRDHTLAALPSAVGAARLFVRHTLSDWRIDTGRAHRIEDAVGELVAHSVATTGIADAGPLYRDEYAQLQTLVVRLRLVPDLLVAEVWDRTEQPPHPQLRQSAAVRATDDYDFAVPRPGRRVAWCSVVPPRLPKRVPRPVRAPLTLEARDLPPTPEPTAELLTRVLGGLQRWD